MKAGVAARLAAAKAIAAVLDGETLDKALEKHIAEIDERDRSLSREIAYGTVRFYPRLCALLQMLLKHPLKKKDNDVYALALSGLYQLTYMRIPPHAAVSATVDAVGAMRKKSLSGLLNAVLRRYQREQSRLETKLSADAALAQPNWFWRELGVHWPAQRDAIAKASNEKPPMTLRVNLSRVNRADYQQRLQAADIESREGKLSPAALTLDQAVDVERLPGFFEGDCSVQDEAAQMAAYLLGAKSGERVLDACAAPGGKTGHLLELQPEIGELVAGDISPSRLERVQQNLDRLGFAATRLECKDYGEPGTTQEPAGYDAILLDVPCSATGVVRRHPDIKVLRRTTDIASFAAQQKRLLNGLWPQVKHGGRILYVTCSILPEENAGIVEQFLAQTPDAVLSALPDSLGEDCVHGRQLLPQPGGHDGLFFALIGKRD